MLILLACTTTDKVAPSDLEPQDTQVEADADADADADVEADVDTEVEVEVSQALWRVINRTGLVGQFVREVASGEGALLSAGRMSATVPTWLPTWLLPSDPLASPTVH